MSILKATEKPFYYAVIYTSPPKGYIGTGFKETASMLVANSIQQPIFLQAALTTPSVSTSLS